MIERVTDPDVIASVTDEYVNDLDPVSWAAEDRNICLKKDSDYSFFHHEKPGLYSGHWFFSSRGREAKRTALEMLDTAFSDYPIDAIIGFTPLTNLGARWLARQVGFQSQGSVFRRGRPFEFFLLTKQWHTKAMT